MTEESFYDIFTIQLCDFCD